MQASSKVLGGDNSSVRTERAVASGGAGKLEKEGCSLCNIRDIKVRVCICFLGNS